MLNCMTANTLQCTHKHTYICICACVGSCCEYLCSNCRSDAVSSMGRWPPQKRKKCRSHQHCVDMYKYISTYTHTNIQIYMSTCILLHMYAYNTKICKFVMSSRRRKLPSDTSLPSSRALYIVIYIYLYVSTLNCSNGTSLQGLHRLTIRFYCLLCQVHPHSHPPVSLVVQR